MTKFLQSTIGVTGASGHLGRRVLELLAEAGAPHVVALTRDPGKLTGQVAQGVELRAASFDRPEALAAAFAGIDRLLIISTDAVGNRTSQHTAAIAAAEAAGVRHVVYTSLTSPYPDATNPIADSHFWTEARLAAGPLGWSILRNNQYTDYLLPGAAQAIASGQLLHAAADGRRAYVTRNDCAAAAAAALLAADGRRIYDIGGSEALSGDDLAALYATASGRPVTATSLPGPALLAGLVQAGMPQDFAQVLVRFDTDAAKGYLGITAGHFAELVGRPPETVAAFLAANPA